MQSKEDVHQCIEFLQRFHPATNWTLVTIGADGKVGPAATFDPMREKERARQFIERHIGKSNIYFTVNRVESRLTKKPSKSDISEIHYLHVDVDLDVRDWADRAAVAKEMARVLHLLRSYKNPPTAIIWTGGGYQAYWRLSEIIVVNGEPHLMVSAERRMQLIEKQLGGDACHNADRIMRLPGTINVLSKTKVAAGRTPARAELIEFNDDLIHDLQDLPEIAREEKNDERFNRSTAGGDVGRIRAALMVIPSDDRSIWIEVAMGLKSELDDSGFGLWRDWSLTSVKWDEADGRLQWRSLSSDGGRTIASVFGLAKQHGWLVHPPNNGTRDRTRTSDLEEPRNHKPADASPSIHSWPLMQSKMMHGVVGRIAKLATAHSEADPVAVIATTLAYAAAEFGRAQYTRVRDTPHHSRHFNAIVGRSSRARKGTSYYPVKRIFERAEEIRRARSTLPFPPGLRLQRSHGPLSSGEGIVFAVRDGCDDGEGGDAGVLDKRLLVVEEELAAALRANQRQGNNLSMILRMAYDGQTISPLTKNNRVTATEPHINIIAHITQAELKEQLATVDICNGFANRFQWLMAKRSKEEPFPKPMPDDQVEEIAAVLANVIVRAH